jgi:hypothetical protein
MVRIIAIMSLALVATLASLWISPFTDERAMYGHDGPVEQNLQSREVGGWPAPFLADNPNTSVPHQLGVEDNFRPGQFVGTLSFWLLVVGSIFALIRRMRS